MLEAEFFFSAMGQSYIMEQVVLFAWSLIREMAVGIEFDLWGRGTRALSKPWNSVSSQ